MRINKKITVAFILFLAVIFLLPDVASAQSDIYGVNNFTDTNLSTKDLKDVVVNIVNIILGFLGILATLIILYGGFVWMTSGGNADKVDKAKKIIINGVIGLAIILSSYAIARFVLKEGYNSMFGGGGGPGGGYIGGVGLGGGVLQSHYPARNAIDIPRNTNIFVTFNEPMLDNFVTNAGCSYFDAEYTYCVDDSVFQYIKIFIDDGFSVPLAGDDIMVKYNPANPLVFEFNPYGNDLNNHLGDPNGNVLYKVVLDSIETQGGNPAFTFGFYDWNFTVSNVLDLTPPEVVSVIPDGSNNPYPPNSAVQINFSEAVNPIYATGEHPGAGPPFVNITMDNGAIIDGEYTIANQYRTVAFLTDVLCGTNSCGEDIFCLPFSDTINGTVTDVIEDMAGNELDSNGNGTGGEGVVDHYTWAFVTSNNIVTTPPNVSYMDTDNSNPGGMPLLDPIEIQFDRTMLATSFSGNTLALFKNSLGDSNFWFTFASNANTNDTVFINHDVFEPLTSYAVTSTSGLRDSLQNCWYPCNCNGPSCDCDTGGACGAGGCQTN